MSPVFRGPLKDSMPSTKKATLSYVNKESNIQLRKEHASEIVRVKNRILKILVDSSIAFTGVYITSLKDAESGRIIMDSC